MADTLLQVSPVKDPIWTASMQIESERRLTGISYKVTLNGRTSFRVVFPVYSGHYTSIPYNECLLTVTDWENISLVTEQEGVYATRDGLLPGIYDVDVDKALTEVVFQLTLPTPLTPYTGTGKAVCKLQYSITVDGKTRWVNLPDPVTILISETSEPPAVIKFTAQHIVVASNDTTILEWEVINSTSITINDGKKNLNIPRDKFKGKFATGSLLTDTVFTLTAVNDSHLCMDAIQVNVNKNSAFVPVKNLFDGQKLMGLYRWADKLYALVLYELATGEKNVLFWESFDGLNWQKSNVYSKSPGFTTTNPEIKLQVNFAGSPGVVYNNKLYLIGGSRFDSDFRSRSVYYFDFGLPEQGWQQDADAGFTPRMGHACLVYKGEIWVIGGYGDQGAINEVWKFNGVDWSNITNAALPVNRCMLSAIVNSEGNMEIYGGFSDFPGAPDQSLANSYVFDTSWKPIRLSKGTEALNYVCCTAVQTRGQSFLFNTVFTNKFSDRIQMLIRNDTVSLKDMLSPTDFGIQEYIFNIQAIDFKDVVWVCALHKSHTIESNQLSYFVYVPLN